MFIETPSGRVFGQASGDPQNPLILGIHGWSQRNGWQTWEPLLKPLGLGGYHIVSLDMPGWGQSEPFFESAITMQQGAVIILEILKALQQDEAVLMGKSWGGGVAIETALAHPEKVNKLILTAPAFSDLKRLEKLKKPVLLVWAEDDPVIPYQYAAKVEDALEDVRLVTYATGGHNAAPNNADLFAPIALDFLNR